MIHHLDQDLAILDADVHVQPENEVGPGHQLHIFDNILVALTRRKFLRAPVRKRMRRRRGQPQPILPRQADHVPAQALQFFPSFLNIGANRRPHLHHRLVHLRLDPFLQDQFALLDDLGMDMRPKIPSLGIDGLIFFFDSQRECWLHRGIQRCQAGRRSGRSPISIPMAGVKADKLSRPGTNLISLLLCTGTLRARTDGTFQLTSDGLRHYADATNWRITRQPVSLWVAWYNFCRVNSAIRCTPAMQAGLATTIWTMRELPATGI